MTLPVPRNWTRPGFCVSTDSARIQLDRLHAQLSRTYWAAGIPRETVERSIRHSLVFGVYALSAQNEEQIGLARVMSDYATFAYIADVYVEEAFRGRGLSKWLMECVLAHPDLQGLRRICLATKDAHGLYERFGFRVTEQTGNWMEIKRANPYGVSM